MVSQGNPTYDHQAGTEHLSQANEAPGDKKETATRKSLSKNHQSGNNLTMTKEEEAPCECLGFNWPFALYFSPSSPQIPEPQEVTFRRSCPCPIFKVPGGSFMPTEQSKNASSWHSESVPHLLSPILHHEPPSSSQKSIPFSKCSRTLQDWALAHAVPYLEGLPCALSCLKHCFCMAQL